MRTTRWLLAALVGCGGDLPAPARVGPATAPSESAIVGGPAPYEDPRGLYRVQFEGTPTRTSETKADDFGGITRTDTKFSSGMRMQFVTDLEVSGAKDSYCDPANDGDSQSMVESMRRRCRVSSERSSSSGGFHGRVVELTCEKDIRALVATYCDGSRIRTTRKVMTYLVVAMYGEATEENGARRFVESFELRAPSVSRGPGK